MQIKNVPTVEVVLCSKCELLALAFNVICSYASAFITNKQEDYVEFIKVSLDLMGPFVNDVAVL